jgi:outer membrane protein
VSAFDTAFSSARKIYSLDECLKIALQNATTVNKAKNQKKFSDAELLSGYGKFLPEISVGADYYPYENSYSYLVAPGIENTTLLSNVKSSSFKYYIRGTLNLFNGFSDYNSLKKSMSNSRYVESTIKYVKTQLAYDVIKNYYQVALNKKIYEIQQNNYDLSLKRLAQIKQKVAVGELSNADLMQQEAKVSLDLVEVVKSKNDLENSKLSLISKMLIDPVEEYDFIDPKKTSDTNINLYKNLDSLVSIAKKKRQDLIASGYKEDSYKYSLREAKGGYYPKINLVAQLSSNAITYDNVEINNVRQNISELPSTADQLGDNLGFMYGFELKWKIFDQFLTNLNVQKEKVNYLNSGLERQELWHNIQSEIVKARNEYNSSIQSLMAAHSSLKSAKTAYDIIMQRYDLGASDYVDLTEAQKNMNNAMSQLVQSEYNLEFQKVILSYLIGVLNVDAYE